MAPEDDKQPPKKDAPRAESESSETAYLEPAKARGSDGGFMRTVASPASDRYQIGETLGEGGMAVVQLATDTQLKRPVAVKRLRSELAHKENTRERFFSEAEILAGLVHPGTTPIYEAGRLPDGDCFYAMQPVSGKTLRDLLADRIPKDIQDRADRAHFIEIFVRLCQTVAAAHNQGVIHRDIKPENVMVDDLGAVYVMDWGLAKRLPDEDEADSSDSQRTRVGAVMGTPAYMSPEQASGHGAESDRQTDVFSLGVMLYEILTGKNPFKGGTAVESMKGVMYHQPDPPQQHNPRIDRTLSAITMKALDKDPFRRYPSAHELAEDIRRYREYLPVSVIKPRLIDRLANWSRRRPHLAAALATLTGVLVFLALGTVLQASIDNARVAEGYRVIDRIDVRLEEIEIEIDRILERSRSDLSETDRESIENLLAELEAEQEVAEQERMAIGLAITGFTLLAPDERATRVVRESILDGIREHLAAGDFYRARAQIKFALRHFDASNIFGFSEKDHRLLQEELSVVEREIAAAEVLGTQPVD
jgi:serine/threonine protein kinase